MNKQQRSLRTVRTAVAASVLAGAGIASFGALAATSSRLNADERAQIEQTYRSERAACLDGSSVQDKQTCLTEANAARAAARAGQLESLAEPDYQANAAQRCEAVPTEARDDCMRRVNGEGTMIGSVTEGVIIRELPSAQTEQVAAVDPAALLSDSPAPVTEVSGSIDVANDSRLSSQGGLVAAGGEGEGSVDAAVEPSDISTTDTESPPPVMPANTGLQPEAALDPAAPALQSVGSGGLTEGMVSQAGPDLYNDTLLASGVTPTPAADATLPAAEAELSQASPDAALEAAAAAEREAEAVVTENASGEAVSAGGDSDAANAEPELLSDDMTTSQPQTQEEVLPEPLGTSD